MSSGAARSAFSRTDTQPSALANRSSWFALPGSFRAIKRELSDFVKTITGDDEDEAKLAGKRRGDKPDGRVGKRRRTGEGTAFGIAHGETAVTAEALDRESVVDDSAVLAPSGSAPSLQVATAGTHSASFASLQHRSFTPVSGLSSSTGMAPTGSPPLSASTRSISPRPRHTKALGGPNPRHRHSRGALSCSISSIDSVLENELGSSVASGHSSRGADSSSINAFHNPANSFQYGSMKSMASSMADHQESRIDDQDQEILHEMGRGAGSASGRALPAGCDEALELSASLEEFELLEPPNATPEEIANAASTSRTGKRKRVASERQMGKAMLDDVQNSKRIKHLETEVERLKQELEHERAEAERNRRELERERARRRQSGTSHVHFPSSASSPVHQASIVPRKPPEGALLGGSPFIVPRPYGDGPDAVGERTPKAKAPKIRGSGFGVGLPGLARDLFGAGMPTVATGANGAPPSPPPPPPPPPPPLLEKGGTGLTSGKPRKWADPLKQWPDPGELQSQSRGRMTPSKQLEKPIIGKKSTLVGMKGVDMGKFVSEIKNVKLRKTSNAKSLTEDALPARPRVTSRNERILHAALKHRFSLPVLSEAVGPSTRPVRASMRAPRDMLRNSTQIQAEASRVDYASTRDAGADCAPPERHELARTVYPSSASKRSNQVVMGKAMTTPRRVSAGSMELEIASRQAVLPGVAMRRHRSASVIDMGDQQASMGLGKPASVVVIEDSDDEELLDDVELRQQSIRFVDRPTANGGAMHSDLAGTDATPGETAQLANVGKHRRQPSPRRGNPMDRRPETAGRKLSHRSSGPRRGAEAADQATGRPASILSKEPHPAHARSSTQPSQAAALGVDRHHPRELSVDESGPSVYEGKGTVPCDPSGVVGFGVPPGAAEGTSGKDWVVVNGGRALYGDGERNEVRWGLKPSALFSTHPRLLR